MSNDNKPTNVEKIYAFDTLYTTNHIQMLKILLPCLNPHLQKTLALYIKFLELCYTFSFLKAHPNGIKGCGFDKPPTDWQIISDELLPYLSPEEAERIRQMKQAFQMMKQFESMQSMMEKLDGILPENMNFQDLFNQMANQNKSDSFQANPFPNISSAGMENLFGENMLTKEQKDLYEKFNQRFKDL